MIIVVPYAWYAIKINSYARETRPDQVFPSYSQLWVSLLGMAVFTCWKHACTYLQPLIMYFVPTKDSKKEPLSEDERQKVALKLEGHIVDGTMYLVSTIWGYMVCKDKDWMPWYLLGEGDFSNAFIDVPFQEVDQVVLFYGLF